MTLSSNKVTNKEIKKPLRNRETPNDFEESIINDKKTCQSIKYSIK